MRLDMNQFSESACQIISSILERLEICWYESREEVNVIYLVPEDEEEEGIVSFIFQSYL